MAKVLMMGMSLRKGSFNKKLIKNAYRLLQDVKTSHEIEELHFNNYPMPVYDGDLESEEGIPKAAVELGEKIAQADALILSTPEYNGSIPGPFKNAIDWVSRISPMPWNGKKILLLGASPGRLGAIRSLGHSRVPLTAVGTFVYPEMFGLSQAHKAFDDSDVLTDQGNEERLRELLKKFLEFL